MPDILKTEVVGSEKDFTKMEDTVFCMAFSERAGNCSFEIGGWWYPVDGTCFVSSLFLPAGSVSYPGVSANVKESMMLFYCT